MKALRFFTSSILIAFLLILSVAASAGTASLKVSGVYGGETIIVHAELCDIDSPVGIACIEYNILYDRNLLKLDAYNVNFPDAWREDVDSEMAENLSVAGDGIFKWAMVNAEIEKGVKEDGQLFVDLTFSILDSTVTDFDIVFNCVAVTDDMLETIDCDSYTLHIHMDGTDTSVENSDSNFSTDFSVPTQSAPNGSVSQSYSDPANSNTDNSAATDSDNTDADNSSLIFGIKSSVFVIIFASIAVVAVVVAILVSRKKKV